jgi:amino acid adenylation domain-containing protein
MIAGLDYVSPRQHYLRRLAAPHGGTVYAACCSVRVSGQLDRRRFLRAARLVIGRDDGWREALGADTHAGPPAVCELDLRGIAADERARQLDRVWDAIERASAIGSASEIGSARAIGSASAIERASANGSATGVGAAVPARAAAADAPACVVVACGDDEHVVFLRIPAIAGDLPTLHRFVEDIDRVYHDAPLAEAIGYGEFVEWQHEVLTAADAGMGRAFWEERRTPERLAVRLPYDARISSDAFDATFSPVKEAIVLDADSLSASAALAREMGVASDVPLLTCWAILLGRIADLPDLVTDDVRQRDETAGVSGRKPVNKDLVVGMMLDGRVQDDLAGAAGPYTEAVPLRVMSAPAASFRECLDAVRQEIAQAERWRTWFTWPEESAESAESEESAPLLPFLPFLFEALPAFAVAAGRGTLRYAIERQQACLDRFTLKLTCREDRQAHPRIRYAALTAVDDQQDRPVQQGNQTVTRGLDLWYDAACYDATAARTLAAQYAALLRRCVATPDAAIETGWMLGVAERDRILVQWNQTDQTDDASLSNRCVHELFEAQVERTPDLVAIRQSGAIVEAVMARQEQAKKPVGAADRVQPDSQSTIAATVSGERAPAHFNAPPARRELVGAAGREQRDLESTIAATVSGESTPAHFNAPPARRERALVAEVALTYRELNARANRLAHRLRDRHHVGSAGSEVFVGLCLPRGVNLIVAILATLKAGAAYVPLDPSQPVARLGAILDRVAPAVVLTERELLSCLPENITTLCLDDDEWQTLASTSTSTATATAELAENPRRPAHDADAARAAYVLHTSGSTGEPKGVVITHGALSNYVRWAARTYDVMIGTVAPLHTPIGFDLTLTSLFPPLISGGVVDLLPEEPGLEALSRFLADGNAPALVKLTPAHLDLLAEKHVAGGGAIARPLTLVIGGEALAAETIQAWATCAPRSRFINEYGPTEATVGCCVYEASDPARERGGVRIGRPIANTRLFVLDEAGEPVPIGCAGALHIAGDGVARGYLHAPDATAASFVPNPFGPAGSRMYRTGDRARYWPDGGLEFLGREDDQIKLHGFRIEPDEIERALRQHPQVRQAAVMIVGARRQARLHACIAASGPAPEPDEWRAFLDAHVPAYMMPATFAVMDRLPLTPNGKIDRQALAAAAAAAENGGERTPHRVAPRDEWEAHLVRIWEDILQRRPIGVRDRFFDLGGQSFLAIRLVARVEREFGRMLPVTILFEEGTIESMAAALVDTGDEPGSPLVRMQTLGDAPPFFCVQPIGGSVYSFVPLARRLAPDRPFVGLGGRYWLDAADLKDDTLEALAARYVRAIRQEMPAGEYHLGGWSSGGVVAFEMARQLAAEGHRVARLVLIDSVTPEPLVELDDATFLRRVIAERTGTDVPLDEQMFESLAPEQRLAAVRGAAVAHGLLDLDIRTEQVQAYVTQQQRAARMVCSYTPGAYDGVVTLLRASESHEALPAADVDRGAERDGARGGDGGVDRGADYGGDRSGDDASASRDLSYGWTRFLSQPIDIHIVPGRHTTMVMEPHAEALAAELSRVLAGESPRE